MRWLLTGDWQTQFSNLALCQEAHEQEMDLLREGDLNGHIDLGDLKNDYSPIDVRVIQFQFRRTKNIAEVVGWNNTIKLMGNHDRIGQYADNANWFSLFHDLGAIAVEEKQILRYADVVFYCLPFSRDTEVQKRWAKELAHSIEAKRKSVLLFHHDIRGAKYSNVVKKPSDSVLTTKTLRMHKYDQCFGGHIHKRQKLAENAWYVGNPFACDWGEINQSKGFLVYDSKKNTVEVVKSKVPGRYSFAYLQRKKITTILPGTKIQDKVVCSAVGDYHATVSERLDEITRLYPAAIVSVIPQFTVDAVVEGGLSELSENSPDLEKVKVYIHATIPTDLVEYREKVVAYFGHLIDRLSASYLRATDKVQFTKVTASNVLSFKEVEFSFARAGIIQVCGVNGDWENHSNGAGKSNLFSLIPVALYGKTFKGQKNDQWANWRTKKSASVRLKVLTEKGDIIEVFRQRRPMKLQVFLNGEDKSAGVNHKDTQKIIEQYVGYSYETFANAVYVDQSLANAFLTGTDKTRAELLHKFQNLDRFAVAKKYAQEDLAKLVEEEREYATVEEVVEAELANLRQLLKDQRERVKEALAKLRDEVKEAEAAWVREKNLFTAMEKKYAEKIDNLKDAILLRQRKETKFSQQVYLYTSKVREAREKLAEVSEKGKVCEACGRPLDEVVRKKLVIEEENRIAQYAKQLREIKEELLTVVEERKEASSSLQKITELLTEEGNKVRALQGKVVIKKQMLEEAEEQEDLGSRTQEYLEKISKLEEKKKACVAALGENTRQQMIVKYAVSAFGRTGVPAFFNKLVCPVLNHAAAYYSELFVQREIQVVFEIEDGSLVPKILNAHGDKEIVGQSTGEKAWAGLIASLALREIAQPANLLILDEPGHGLDVEGVKKFGEQIKKLTKRFETVLVTTHNLALQSALADVKKITVTKKNHFSWLQI